MRYNFAVPNEVERAEEYFAQLKERKKMVDIKAVSPKRSLKQNAYLHLIINAFAVHWGYTAAESKQIYKELNKNVYAYTKNNRTFYRSSADLTKEDMKISIDRFREASAEQGYPLPLATDEAWLRSLENAIEGAKAYL